MATLFVDKIDPQSGTTLSLGSSGDTIQATAGTTNNLGISEADQWRLTADLTANESPLSSNLARPTNTGFSKIGTGMSVSSGVWTFPSTGLWKIEANVLAILASNDAQIILAIRTYINSSAADVANAVMGSLSDYTMGNTSFLYNVTNTSTHQLVFRVYSLGSGGSIRGDATLNETHFNFIRLGDSQ